MSTQDTISTAWTKVADSIDKLQRRIAECETLDDLINRLLEAELPLDSKEDLSVIYQFYGNREPTCLVRAGKPVPAEERDSKTMTDFVQSQVITDITNDPNHRRLYLEDAASCQDAGLGNYANALIVPMRVDEYKNIGVFVIHSTQPKRYHEQWLHDIFDRYSDRVAFFIRNFIRRQRNRIFEKVRNDLFSKAEQYNTESEILAAVVENMRGWYRAERIYMLLAKPLDPTGYVLACDNNQVSQDFQFADPIDAARLQELAGSPAMLEQLQQEDGRIVVTQAECEAQGIQSDCQSWAGAALRLADGRCLGYVILHNPQTEYAYEFGESSFLSNIANFTALLLADFQQRQQNRMIRSINTYDDEPQELLSSVHQQLSHLLKTKDLAFYELNRVKIELQPLSSSRYPLTHDA